MRLPFRNLSQATTLPPTNGDLKYPDQEKFSSLPRARILFAFNLSGEYIKKNPLCKNRCECAQKKNKNVIYLCKQNVCQNVWVFDAAFVSLHIHVLHAWVCFSCTRALQKKKKVAPLWLLFPQKRRCGTHTRWDEERAKCGSSDLHAANPCVRIFEQQLRSLATSDESVVGHGLRERLPDAAIAAIPYTNCLFYLFIYFF